LSKLEVLALSSKQIKKINFLKFLKTIKMHTNKTYRPFLNFAIVKFLYDFELDQKERKLKVDKVTGGTLYYS